MSSYKTSAHTHKNKKKLVHKFCPWEILDIKSNKLLKNTNSVERSDGQIMQEANFRSQSTAFDMNILIRVRYTTCLKVPPKL